MEKKITTAAPMVQLKIDLNNKYRELYETQIKGLILQKDILEMDIESCKKRIAAINLVNRIEKMQLDEFDADRQKDINSMTNDSNEMGIDDIKFKESLLRKLDETSAKIYEIVQEAGAIKEKIPETGTATNYKVTINQTSD